MLYFGPGLDRFEGGVIHQPEIWMTEIERLEMEDGTMTDSRPSAMHGESHHSL
jgi:hypothetical protein